MYPGDNRTSWHQVTRTCTIDSTNPLDAKEELYEGYFRQPLYHSKSPAAISTEVALVVIPTILVAYQAKFRNQTVHKLELSTNLGQSPLVFRVRRDPQWHPSGGHRLPGRHHLHFKISVSCNGHEVLPPRTRQQCCSQARSFLSTRRLRVNGLL